MKDFWTTVLRPRLGRAFTFERTVSRLLGAYLIYTACTMLTSTESFAKLAFGQSTSLSEVALYTALLFLLLSAASVAVDELLHTDSFFLLIGTVLCAWIWLVGFDHKTDNYLFTLAVSLCVAFVFVWFARVNAPHFAEMEPNAPVTGGIVAALAVLSCFLIGAIGVLRYKTFSSPNFDFGLFVNMFHNMRETGLPTVSSERDQLLSHFAVHISPIYYVLLPFYWLFPTPETLQIGQAVALTAGVIPLYFLCRHFKLSGKVTVLVSALYLFYPALTAGTFYDLHENCFLPLCLLSTFLFFEKKKYIPMYLCALSVLAVKEDAAIYLAIFALFVLLSERKYLHGAILAGLSVGYFLLAVYLLETNGTGIMSNRFGNLIYEKDAGLVGAIKTALVNPGFLLTQVFTTSKGTWEKFAYLLQLLLPVGLLPFCSKKPSRWLLLVPVLLNTLTNYVYQYDLGFQYHFGITAFLFYAVVKNLPELELPTCRTLLSVATAACLCLYIATVVPKYTTYTERYASGKEQYRQMDEILDTVPEDASVACSSFLLAHFADRTEIYEVSYHGNKPDVDYVVLDARYASHKEYKTAYLAYGYRIVSEEGSPILILQK